MLREIIEQLDKLPEKVMTNCLEIDAGKCVIGIVSAENEQVLAHSGLSEICERVRRGITAAGATAKLLHVPSVDCTALHGSASMKYDLPSRELTANAVETLACSEFFDALVFVSSEPNVTAGMLIGAIRLNIPCIFVCGGTMSPIVYEKQKHGFIHFFEQIAKIKTGKTPYEKLAELENLLPLVAGTDCERYGANSFNCVLEAVGLALRGNGTAAALSSERKKIAYDTGRYAVELANEKLTPRRILTQSALANAAIFDLACGGSSTTMLNLIAVAKELGIKNITLKTIGDMGKSTPTLLFDEDESNCIMPEFHEAGGVYALLKQLREAKLIKTDAVMFDGQSLQQALENVTVNNSNVIRPYDNCVSSSSRLRVIYGNLAETGAFVQYSGANTFTGSAKVYNNEEMAIDALLHREIRPGDVMVIRNEGPKSCPGMREIFMSLALLKGFGLEDKVAVITDGRIADIYGGIAVGHITPETFDQGAFAVLQDGDEIEISVPKGKIQCDIKAKELSQRFRDHDGGTAVYANFYLKNWAKNCSSASEGCVYKASKR